MNEEKKNFMITERPEGMSFEEYKVIRAYQKQKLKEYKRGKMMVSVWKDKDGKHTRTITNKRKNNPDKA